MYVQTSKAAMYISVHIYINKVCVRAGGEEQAAVHI